MCFPENIFRVIYLYYFQRRLFVSTSNYSNIQNCHDQLLKKSIAFICRKVYEGLVDSGKIVPRPEVAPPTVPMDFNWARVSITSNSSSTRYA